MNFNADDNIAWRERGREVTAGDPCQRARNRNATRRATNPCGRRVTPREERRNFGTKLHRGDLKARIAARAPCI